MFNEKETPTLESESKPDNEFRRPGHRAEEIVENFLEEAFPNFLTIERTTQSDPNDTKGIDFVCRVREQYGLAVDVTFDNDERRREKMMHQLHNPFVFFRNNQGVAEDEMPRILFTERSMGFWFDCQKRAAREGVELISAMDEKNKKEQRLRFIETVLIQLSSLLGESRDRVRRIKPIIEIFEQEKERLKGKKVRKKKVA